MRYTFILSLIILSTSVFAQRRGSEPVTEEVTKKLKLYVGDKFEELGLEGKLFELYKPRGGESCGKTEKGKKITNAAIAYVEFKYQGKKVSSELCYQRLLVNGKEEINYTTERFRAKDSILSISVHDINNEEGLVTFVIVKSPLPPEEDKKKRK